MLGPEVVELIAGAFDEILDEESQTVGEIVLKMSFLYVEHLIKGAGDMESGGVAVGEILARRELLVGQPAFVREGIFEFVAVGPYLVGADDGHNLGKVDLGDARQHVDDLLALAFELKLIGQMLPAAAAADAEMLAAGLDSDIAGTNHPDNMALGERFFLLVELDVDDVAWHGEGDEDNHVVDSRKGVAFGCDVGNLYIFERWKRFAFSCHNLLIINFRQNYII